MEPAMVNESPEDPLNNPDDVELPEVHRTIAVSSPTPVATIPLWSSPAPLPPDSAPHSIPVTSPLNSIIDRIRRDNIASDLVKYQLPATIVGIAFTLISGKTGHYESTGKIMLVLLGMALHAFVAGKVLWDERPVIAAVAEVVGISLSAAAFIYPMSVLLGGPILCYVPPIFGVVIAGMYVYRLATASSGDTPERI